jgi:hypothetical protein
MTERAIKIAVSKLFDDCSHVAVNNFDYSKYGGEMVEPILEWKVKQEIETILEQFKTKFYIISKQGNLNHNNTLFKNYKRSDIVYMNCKKSNRKEVESDLLERYKILSKGLSSAASSDKEDLYEILRDDYDKEKLHLMMGEMFDYTGRMGEYEDITSITINITPVIKIDCTEEAFRLIKLVEDEIQRTFINRLQNKE